MKLSLSLMVDAIVIGGPVRDENRYLALTVTNRGTAPTTITHMVVFGYPSWWWWRLRRKTSFSAIVTNPYGPLPHLLKPGEIRQGSAILTPRIRRMLTDELLYVGIVASHRRRELLVRARPPKMLDATDKLGAEEPVRSGTV